MSANTITKNTLTEASLNTGNSLDITVPDHAYMFGFIQADGHLYETTRNRGRVQIELQEKDEAILIEFARLIPFPCMLTRRVRKTNFAQEHRSVILRVYNRQFREELKSLGMMSGNKARRIATPQCQFSERDYFRGVIDADGSLGLTSNGFPFASLITASESMAKAYLNFVEGVTGKSKTPGRNRRDQALTL